MNSGNLSLFFRTISYLRLEQILYRVWYAIRARCSSRLCSDSHNIPDGIDWIPLKPDKPFLSYAWWDDNEITRGRFCFLNETIEYGADVNWQAQDKGRLWRYNLHYFQYLHPKGGLDSDIGLRLIRHWIDHNPPGTEDAWDPFPISLRLVNWIKYLSNIPLPKTESKPLVRSAYQQALWLERHLEYHLLGNHLFKNAKALVFSGLFFKGPDAEQWLAKGLRLLNQEISEQILSDGGHFERSPMYHAMILEDCLDLLNVCKPQPHSDLKNLSSQLQKVCKKMVVFLKAMTHPDNRISLFNDAAFGIEAEPADLIKYYERITGESIPEDKDSVCSFPDTGYYVLKPTPDSRMLIDCGHIGPDYQPGHAHCDTLSFELSLKGRRVIVDSGCFEYEDGSIRQYNRGNAGHNTLTIDGQNQSEVWGAHRCARRARPLYANLNKQPDGSLVFEGAHDGYKRLKGKPIHHRRISWSGDKCLIEDRVEGKGHHDIESRLHIHPSLTVDFTGEEVVIRDEQDVLVGISLYGDGRIDKTEGWYCPEFGIKKPCVVLTTIHKNVSLPFKCGWIFNIHKAKTLSDE